MARELILIPKSKYEHLLKQVEDFKHQEQVGGQNVASDDKLEVDPVKPESTGRRSTSLAECR